MTKEEFYLLSTFGKFPDSQGSNFFHMKNKNNAYLKDVMQQIHASGDMFSKDFCHMLLQLTTREHAGLTATRWHHATQNTENWNALGTEFYISLGNEIVTFLGMTALAEEMAAWISTYHQGNDSLILQLHVRSLIKKLQENHKAVWRGWPETVPIYFRCRINQENPVGGWLRNYVSS